LDDKVPALSIVDCSFCFGRTRHTPPPLLYEDKFRHVQSLQIPLLTKKNIAAHIFLKRKKEIKAQRQKHEINQEISLI